MLSGKEKDEYTGAQEGARRNWRRSRAAGAATRAVGQQLRPRSAGRRTSWFAATRTRRARKCSPASRRCSASRTRRIPAPEPGAKTSGRRTVLANWIASKDNPLTARVFVNRVWQYHFGRGIVPTAERLRQARRAADAPRTARLARQRVRRGRLEAQAPAQAHHDCRASYQLVVARRRRRT